jgi:hypothetical protein
VPIQLTKSFNPGDIDPDHTYDLIRINQWRVFPPAQLMRITCGYGSMETVDGTSQWRNGLKDLQVTIEGQDFIDLFMAMGDSSKTLYDSIANRLYQYMIDKAIFDGTIVG